MLIFSVTLFHLSDSHIIIYYYSITEIWPNGGGLVKKKGQIDYVPLGMSIDQFNLSKGMKYMNSILEAYIVDTSKAI